MPFRAVRILMFASVIALTVSFGCSRDPETAKRAYVESGDRYMKDHKVAEAIVEYRNAIKQDARFGEARKKLAEAYKNLETCGRHSWSTRARPSSSQKTLRCR